MFDNLFKVCNIGGRELKKIKTVLDNYQIQRIVESKLYVPIRYNNYKYDLSERINNEYNKIDKVTFCHDYRQALKWE